MSMRVQQCVRYARSLSNIYHRFPLNTTYRCPLANQKEFWNWISDVASDSNKHEISKFWARMIPFLSGYFDNWVL